jgi:protein-S-isoprenylcysteine O-methyltransferase Ste14
VNRDPGLAVLYPACGLLVIALVVVFTQKPFLKSLMKRLKARSSAPETVFLAAICTILATFFATLPGIVMIIMMPEGAMQGIGALVVVLGLVLESWFVHSYLRPRLDRQIPSPSNRATGVS